MGKKDFPKRPVIPVIPVMCVSVSVCQPNFTKSTGVTAVTVTTRDTRPGIPQTETNPHQRELPNSRSPNSLRPPSLRSALETSDGFGRFHVDVLYALHLLAPQAAGGALREHGVFPAQTVQDIAGQGRDQGR